LGHHWRPAHSAGDLGHLGDVRAEDVGAEERCDPPRPVAVCQGPTANGQGPFFEPM